MALSRVREPDHGCKLNKLNKKAKKAVQRKSSEAHARKHSECTCQYKVSFRRTHGLGFCHERLSHTLVPLLVHGHSCHYVPCQYDQFPGDAPLAATTDRPHARWLPSLPDLPAGLPPISFIQAGGYLGDIALNRRGSKPPNVYNVVTLLDYWTAS